MVAGSDRAAVSNNIRELMKAGHPQKQAVAAALSKARESKVPYMGLAMPSASNAAVPQPVKKKPAEPEHYANAPHKRLERLITHTGLAFFGYSNTAEPGAFMRLVAAVKAGKKPGLACSKSVAYFAADGEMIVYADHDVSKEPRDDKGEWTAGGGKVERAKGSGKKPKTKKSYLDEPTESEQRERFLQKQAKPKPKADDTSKEMQDVAFLFRHRLL